MKFCCLCHNFLAWPMLVLFYPFYSRLKREYHLKNLCMVDLYTVCHNSSQFESFSVSWFDSKGGAGFEPATRLPVHQTGDHWISTGNFHDDGFNISYEPVIDVCKFGCEQVFLLIFIDLVMSYERESLSIGELLHKRSAYYPLRL